MKGVALWGVGLIFVVVIAGILVYRSTAPNGDVVPEGDTSLEEEPGQAPDSQFLQLQPATGPPTEESVARGEEMTELLASPGDGEEGVAEEKSVADEEAVTISMTDAGFSPTTVTISVGTTVNFVNDGQALHWPASAVHPTHEVLPAFDSKRGIATGDTYSFSFTEAGNWNFHDHLNPQFTGTVVVE